MALGIIAVGIFCCFLAVCQGQLSLEALPDVLFVNNSGVHNVELGTVIRARCTASSSSAPIVVWFKDGDSLLNDPPHIRIRTSTDDTEVTSVLTIDNFNTGDNGDYYCQAYDSTTTLNSTTLSLTVIDDDTISLLRDPVTREIVGGDLAGTLKTYDTIRDNRTSYELERNFDSSLYQASCCQVFRCIVAIPGDQTAAADIDLLSVAWLRNEEKIDHMTGRTEITKTLRYEPNSATTRYITRLILISFQTSDVGIYQCVYSDYDSDRELVFSTPFRLDSDSAAVGLVAVSPVDIILDPPGKLVIEVESSGGYYRHAWYKNDEQTFPIGNSQFRVGSPERFSEFFQVFVQDPTTNSDHGIYRVDLIEEGTSVLDTQEFTVTPPVALSVDALNSTNVTVVEGEDVDISCLASANPLPSDIVWTFAGDSTSFSQTDTTENKTAYITSAGTFSFSEGNITSTLHITAAEYPTNDGVYACSSTSDTTTLNASITIIVQVPPLVLPVISDVIGNENMNATFQFRIDNAHPRVLLSGLRWFYSEQRVDSISQGTVVEITNRTNRTSESRLVTSFSSDGVYFNITVVNIVQERLGGEGTDRGRYFLQATNPAGSSVAFIDLEVYGPPLIISPPVDGFVITGDMSVFQCTALAFPSHYVEWTFVNSDGELTVIITTIAGNNTKYRIDNKKSSLNFGQIVIVDVQYSDRGEYVCRAFNEVGTVNATATLTVHVPPIIEAASPEVRINISEPAVLACLITGYPRPSITWKKNDEVFSTNSARVNIFDFEVGAMNSGNISGINSSGSIADLLRDAEISEEDIQGLGELGMVAFVAFESLERSDTGDYMCSAENSLPGLQTGIKMAIPELLPLTVLEVPDVPTNFANGPYGSRWVSLEWALGFDGNSAVLSFRVRITRQSSEESRVLEIEVTSRDTNSYNVTEGILPFILYEFQVSICNAIGCGRFTDIVTVMTEQDAPNAAPAITESGSPTSTSLRISWSAPTFEKRNGILTDYVVCYTIDPELPMDMWQKTSAPSTNIILTGLSIFTEYTVSVAAATMAGVGPFDSVTVQTLNDTCSEPYRVMFTDVGEISITLEWSEPVVPNGIIQSYLISYRVVNTDSDVVNTVISETELIQLVNLEPSTQYIITVTCVNGAGPGNTSSPAEIGTAFQTALFQIRLLGISDCVQWKEIELNEKKEAVIASVIKAVNELCKCVFSRETFYDIDITAGFQCFDQSPTAVTFRGEIGPSLTANSSQLISYLEQWVATDPTIVVLSSRLSVDSSCSVEISNFNDPECSDMTSTSTKTAIIGGGVGGVLVILVAALALVVVVGLLRTHQKRASYNLSVGKDVDNIYDYPMFNLASTTPTPDAHITTDDNLVYNIHKTRVPADTVENHAYDTPISSTQLPAPSQPSSDRSTIYDDIDPVYEYPASIGKTDSRPLALLPSTASAADMMQLKDSPLLGAQTPCTNAFAGRGNVETSFRI